MRRRTAGRSSRTPRRPRGAGRGSPVAAQLIGDLYRSFMDTETVERLGSGADRRAAGRRSTRSTDPVELCSNCSAGCAGTGIGGPFVLDVDSDPAEPDRYVLNLYQGGIGLPDESYYSDDSTAPIREAYTEFLPEHAGAGRGCRTRRTRPGGSYELETPAGGRPLGSGPVPGQLADLQPEGPGRPGRAAAGAAVGRLAGRSRRRPVAAGAGGRPAAGLLHRPGRPADRGPAAGLEGLAGLADRPVAGARWARPNWWRRTSTSTAAPCPGRRSCGSGGSGGWPSSRWPPARRSAGCTSSGTSRPRPSSGWTSWSPTCWRPTARSISELPWMSERDQGPGAGQAGRVHPEDRLSRTSWRDYGALDRARRTTSSATPRRAAAFDLDRQLAKIGSPVDRLTNGSCPRRPSTPTTTPG